MELCWWSVSPADEDPALAECPSGGLCGRLPADCIRCSFHHNCTYRKAASFSCRPRKGVHCVVSPEGRWSQEREGGALMSRVTVSLSPQDESGQPQSNFSLSITCQFCWQLEPSQYRCSNSTSCMTVSCPRRRYNATCEVLGHVHCLGGAGSDAPRQPGEAEAEHLCLPQVKGASSSGSTVTGPAATSGPQPWR